MREITQRRAVRCRMARRAIATDYGGEGGEPMQLLRASAVALPFVALAILVGVLSVMIRVAG
jgi:hypothetical protein